MTATKLMKTRMNVPPRVLGECSFVSRARAFFRRMPMAKNQGAKKQTERPCLANDSRKNTRLNCADCCICVAVEGGQMHEDAGGWKHAHAPLKGLKRKRPVLDSPLKKTRSGEEMTDKPSCIKNVQFRLCRARRAKSELNVMQSVMQVNCR
ncbi:hypothetical protein [Paraburkholderia fungorum]|uniref:hypothetical protein n=1 Tax=Paraburkholderia fungorum TaxID=134537 RepID=UPI0038BCD4A0